MKLLRNKKAVEGLQELIDSIASKETLSIEMHTVNNLHRQKITRGDEAQCIGKSI